MADAVLDLRDKGLIMVWIPINVSDVLLLRGFTQLDTGYTVTVMDGDSLISTSTVGNGVTLGSDSISWAYSTVGLEFKTYDVEIKSDSTVMGTYFRKRIKLVVSDYVE